MEETKNKILELLELRDQKRKLIIGGPGTGVRITEEENNNNLKLREEIIQINKEIKPLLEDNNLELKLFPVEINS